MNFVASRVEPPPTASNTSICSSLHICAPLRTDSILGFGSIPDNSNKFKPAFLFH